MLTGRATGSRRAGILALLLAANAPACADGPWSVSIGATTDYIFRGVSQTYSGAAAQAGVSYRSPTGWFVGAWGSNVNPYPFGVASIEANLYGGYAWSLTPDVTARASYTRYFYVRDPRPQPYDYGEFAFSLGWRDLLTATVSIQPDSTRYSTLGYRRNRRAAAYELTARYPLVGRLALSGGIGYYDLEQLYGTSYRSSSVGLSYAWGHIEVDLSRFFADATVRRLFDEATADGEWVLSAAYRF